ncbi:MAG: hypothetical protein ACRBBS_01380 [Thalassovita sp.]
MRNLLAIALTWTFCTAANADEPVIESVKTERSGMGWRITVTLAHPDSGWDHYADGWEILDRLGNSLGYRELMHPHVQEQPFTRSLFNVMVPDGERVIFVRPRCSAEGWSKTMTRVELRP